MEIGKVVKIGERTVPVQPSSPAKAPVQPQSVPAREREKVA